MAVKDVERINRHCGSGVNGNERLLGKANVVDSGAAVEAVNPWEVVTLR